MFHTVDCHSAMKGTKPKLKKKIRRPQTKIPHTQHSQNFKRWKPSRFLEITDSEVKVWVTGKDLSTACPQESQPPSLSSSLQFHRMIISSFSSQTSVVWLSSYVDARPSTAWYFTCFLRDHPLLPTWTALYKIAPDLGSDLSSGEN